MSIDEITIRKNIIVRTFHILRENGIYNHHICEDFESRYENYNLKMFGIKTIRDHPNRYDLVIQRQRDIAIEILKENKIDNPQKYFN